MKTTPVGPIVGAVATVALLAGCGQGTAPNEPVAVSASPTTAVSPDMARASTVLSKVGFTATATKPAQGGRPDRMELTNGSDLIRVTWQAAVPVLAENFPSEAQLPNGETYRYQVTGYGGVSCLYERDGRAVILTVLPASAAIATASGQVSPVMKPEDAAGLAQQLS